MPFADQVTLQAFAAPTVLAIGCPPEVSARCAVALEGIGAAFVACDVASATTTTAQRKPLAIVLLEDLYLFDPEEFEALARDVHATLIRIEEEFPEELLVGLFSAAIDATMERRAGARRPRLASAPDVGAHPSTPRGGLAMPAGWRSRT